MRLSPAIPTRRFWRRAFAPRGLLLFGLRNQTGAPTAVLPLDRILEAAPAVLVRSLKKPIFRHPSPSSFEMNAAVIAPIVWYDAAGTARIAVQTHAVQPADGPEAEEARAAIAQLRALLDSLEAERWSCTRGMRCCSRTTACCTAVTLSPESAGSNGPISLTPFTPSASAPALPRPRSSSSAETLLKDSQKTLAPPDSISHSKN